MRFRLLKYCCRIWDRGRVQFPDKHHLRPTVRHWPWVPRFAHLLIDQSQVIPQAVRGELHGRIAQLRMMPRYRHRREALRHAAQLLAEVLPEGDEDAIRPLGNNILGYTTARPGGLGGTRCR